MFKKIYIEITNICNLKCKFCIETNRAKEIMSVEKFEEIVRKIHKHTQLVCLHIKGEPFLYNHLKEILNILEKYKLKANITTNGTLIKQKLETLKNSKAVRQINFSIHSIMQNENINKQYLQDIFESVEKLENVIISYRLWNLDDINENEKNIEILNCLKEYYNMPQLLEQVKENDFIEIGNKKYINLDTIYEWPSLDKEIVSTKGNCYGLVNQIAVLVDGTVVPCCLDQNGVINLGNIFEADLENILNSEMAEKILDGFKCNKLIHSLCQRCGFREVKRR